MMADKNKGGRPSSYKEEYAEQVYKLCLLGAIDTDIANFFEINKSTLNRWKKEHPEFCASIKKGKTEADTVVAQRLFSKATGYERDEVELKVVAIGNNCGSEVQECPIVKHYPSDTTAAIFWLKNRQPEKWRDKTEQEVSLNTDKAATLKAARERVKACRKKT
jgi:hypothetical protein